MNNKHSFHYYQNFNCIYKKITLLLLLFLPVFSFSQDTKKWGGKTVCLSGCVRNNFTGIGEGKAKVSVYAEDGTVVAPSLILISYANRERNGNEFRIEVPKGKYRFHVECEGYKPFDYWYEVKRIGRQQMIKLPDFMIQKDFSFYDDNQLGEVTITATKVKFYHKGDTLVYNADAFKLPDGSMLDDLIRQLPGAEIKGNGEIFINGRKLDFLLLNGKDFFGKNNKIILDNLPYYIVDQLKVYEQKSVRSQALGHQVDANLYVMDVRVKKEYAIGYIGNVEAAGGTNDRFLGRLFALRFTDYSRLSLFAGSNNLNENRKPGADTDWKPSDNTAGTERRHDAGLDFLFENKEETWKETGNFVVSWLDTKNEERSSSETFISNGNTFGRGQAVSHSDNFSINAFNDFTLKTPFFLNLKTDLKWQKFDRSGDSFFASFNAHPDSLSTDTLNTTEDAWMVTGKNLEARQSVQYLRSLSIGDDLEVDAYIQYNKSNGEDFSQYRLRYTSLLDKNDSRHRYNDDNLRNYEYATSLLYRFNFSPTVKWELSYKYKQSDATAEYQKFRLEQINGWTENDYPIDMLPSNLEVMQQVIDNDNSYNTHIKRNTHRLYTKLAIGISKYQQFNISYYADHKKERLHYKSNPLDTFMQRTKWLHNIEVEYQYRNKYRNRIYYHMNQSTPSIMQLIPVRNTYNPLAITIGNPNLGILTYHGLYNDFSYTFGKDKRVETILDNHMGIRYYCNETATSVNYNRVTGVYTYRPESVDGNYRIFLVNSLGFRFKKLSALTLNHTLNYDYSCNVDLYLPNGAESSICSKVYTHLLSEKIKADYDFGKVQVGLIGKVDYRYATSKRNGFNDIHATDFMYGVNMQYQMFRGVSLSTDFKVYSHRGYDDIQMNTNDYIWNIAISRSLLKGRLNVKLQGFDILHNLNNVKYHLNGQGRIETWRRTIPNYWMLHLQYKFNKNPKRK